MIAAGSMIRAAQLCELSSARRLRIPALIAAGSHTRKSHMVSALFVETPVPGGMIVQRGRLGSLRHWR